MLVLLSCVRVSRLTRLNLILPRPIDTSQPNVQSPLSFHFYDSVYAGVVDGAQPLVALQEAREVPTQ